MPGGDTLESTGELKPSTNNQQYFSASPGFRIADYVEGGFQMSLVLPLVALNYLSIQNFSKQGNKTFRTLMVTLCFCNFCWI